MGKTRDLFKKMRDTKGTFHAKMGSIKDRNGKDLTESEEIKKRWQEYTEELYRKGCNDPDNHDGVIAHLEPDSVSARQCGPDPDSAFLAISFHTLQLHRSRKFRPAPCLS